jgi:chromosomal replication initiation ATPase DnaA
MSTPDDKNHDIIRDILRLKSGVERTHGITIDVDISYYEPAKKHVTLEQFTAFLCEELDVTWDQIKGSRGLQPIAEARFCYCFLRRKYFNHGVTVIGKDINRDHTTILHAINTVKDRIECNDFFFIQKLNMVEKIFTVVEEEEAVSC